MSNFIQSFFYKNIFKIMWKKIVINQYIVSHMKELRSEEMNVNITNIKRISIITVNNAVKS